MDAGSIMFLVVLAVCIYYLYEIVDYLVHRKPRKGEDE